MWMRASCHNSNSSARGQIKILDSCFLLCYPMVCSNVPTNEGCQTNTYHHTPTARS